MRSRGFDDLPDVNQIGLFAAESDDRTANPISGRTAERTLQFRSDRGAGNQAEIEEAPALETAYGR